MVSTKSLITSLAFLGLITAVRGSAAQPSEADDQAQAEPDLTLPSESYTHGESEPQPMMAPMFGDVAAPPLQGSRVFGEAVVGMGLGFAASAFLLWTGPVEYCLRGCQQVDLRTRQSMVGLVAVGMALGSAGGVTLVGTRGDQTGSYWSALGGGMVGALTALVASLTIESHSVDLLLAATLPPLGATIGFNMSRAYEPGKGPGYDLAATRSWSGPALAITPDPLHPGTTIKSIRLVGGEF